MKNKQLQGILVLTLTGFICSSLLYLVMMLVGWFMKTIYNGIIKENIEECKSYTEMYKLTDPHDERVKLAVSVLQTFFTLLIK